MGLNASKVETYEQIVKFSEIGIISFRKYSGHQLSFNMHLYCLKSEIINYAAKIRNVPCQGLMSMPDTGHLTGTSGKCLVHFLAYRTMSGTFAYQI